MQTKKAARGGIGGNRKLMRFASILENNLKILVESTIQEDKKAIGNLKKIKNELRSYSVNILITCRQLLLIISFRVNI
jgi:ABC-type lipopolysaccharide export system ATPase subunit